VNLAEFDSTEKVHSEKIEYLRIIL